MNYLELLRRHDDPTYWEYPPGFDYRSASCRFAGFVADLFAKLEVVLCVETGSHIQDASFHSQIDLSLAEDRFAQIRFSNFGNMVSVSNDELVPEPMMRTVKELFSQHGYDYVPASVLDMPYTGSNPGVTGIASWWVRYFDWV